MGFSIFLWQALPLGAAVHWTQCCYCQWWDQCPVFQTRLVSWQSSAGGGRQWRVAWKVEKMVDLFLFLADWLTGGRNSWKRWRTTTGGSTGNWDYQMTENKNLQCCYYNTIQYSTVYWNLKGTLTNWWKMYSQFFSINF